MHSKILQQSMDTGQVFRYTSTLVTVLSEVLSLVSFQNRVIIHKIDGYHTVHICLSNVMKKILT